MAMFLFAYVCQIVSDSGGGNGGSGTAASWAATDIIFFKPLWNQIKFMNIVRMHVEVL